MNQKIYARNLQFFIMTNTADAIKLPVNRYAENVVTLFSQLQ